MNNFTPYEQRIIVATLIAIMEVEIIIDPNETVFLNSIIEEFGMPQEELDQISEYDLNLVIQDYKNLDRVKKEEVVKLIIDIAKCDGFTHPRIA